MDESTTLTAVAWSIQIRYHDSDLARYSSTTSSSSSGNASLQSSGGSAPQTLTPNVGALPTSISYGLSTGAKAAIGVTIPVVFIALIVGVFLVFRSSKKRKVTASSHSDLDGNVPLQEGPGISWRAEMDAITGQPQGQRAGVPASLKPVVPSGMNGKSIHEADSTQILQM